MRESIHAVTVAFMPFFLATSVATADIIWQEAESMGETGKWSNDPQHIDIMGSPYLLATGLGKPVNDAVSAVTVKKAGTYTLWVRCRDWLPSHSPGQFQVFVNGKASGVTFGKAKTDAWQWMSGGEFKLTAGDAELRLHDITGWWGRCDVIVLANGDFQPADGGDALAAQRLKHAGVSPEIKNMGKYDLVVVGGGPAGMGASLAAARNGLRVALIQDRPALGGNASSEIEVPPMGYIGSPPDRRSITGLPEELFGKRQSWGARGQSEHFKARFDAETSIALFLNTRGVGVEMDGDSRIRTVIGQDVRSGQRMRFSAPLFADTTGHGWIGFYAGAEYRMGAEGRDEFNESLAPVKATKLTMGNSLYKAVFAVREEAVPFDCPYWVHQWEKDSDFEPRGSHRRIGSLLRPGNFTPPTHGKGRNPGDNPDGHISRAWWIEYGGVKDTIQDAEHIRDELFRISIGLWNYAKNHNPKTKERNAKRELVWLNYVPGSRESRRLMGDYIMSQKDYDTQEVHDDTVAFTDWGPDIHHPEGFWVKGNDAIHVYKGRRTSIPYRTLYSKNIENLFMAGRCHSATQVAMGGTRVMRPMCATGQAAGTAAAIATKYQTTPRGVYEKHVKELQDTLVKDGCRLMRKGGGMLEPHGESKRENLKGVVIDDAEARFTGDWANGAWKPVVGSGYRHDGDSSKGEKIASFTLNVAKPGKYKVLLLYVPGDNRSSNTPVKLTISGRQESFIVNQKVADAGGKALGTFQMDKAAILTISNKGTDGHVIVDGVQLIAVPGD